MSTMNISLPEALKRYVDERVASGDYGTSSEYVRELIRKDQDVRRFRELIVEGLSSPAGALADDAYFEGMRERVRRPAAKR
jgi:antitoxin ParD1/3/4